MCGGGYRVENCGDGVMDAREIARLLKLIQDNGHEQVYDPRTRQELEAWGRPGYAETVLGPLKVVPSTVDAKKACAVCLVIVPGEMLARPDNKVCPCAWGCGRTVQHRPWVTLPRVCLYCMSERPKDNQ